MSNLTPKQRLLRVLQRQTVDRPPVICPGGMMNSAIVEVMQTTGHDLPAAHQEAHLMAALATDVQELTGFENIGIPFCMTVEAEILGSQVDLGSLKCEPKVVKEKFASVKEAHFPELNCLDLSKSARAGVLGEAVALLSSRHPQLPVIASLTGPISVAASMVDPMTFFREVRKDADNCHRLLDYISAFLVALAKFLHAKGADVITIGDPTATGEILGPKAFKEYAVPYLNKVMEPIKAQGIPVILHICGDMNKVKPLLPELKFDAISTDAMVNLKLLKAEYPQFVTMGNLSTYLLEFGDPQKVVARTEHLLQEGIDIIAPACGLSTSTSLSNIQAMTTRVRG